jgi:hypothetical protein
MTRSHTQYSHRSHHARIASKQDMDMTLEHVGAELRSGLFVR